MTAVILNSSDQIDNMLADALRLVAHTEAMRIKLHIRTTGAKIRHEDAMWEYLCNARKNKK